LWLEMGEKGASQPCLLLNAIAYHRWHGGTQAYTVAGACTQYASSSSPLFGCSFMISIIILATRP
jgi:hypothetical protein